MAYDEVAAARKHVMSKSAAAKKAKAGKDMGKPGKGFDKMVAGLTGKYGAERAKEIAGAQFQRMRKRGQL